MGRHLPEPSHPDVVQESLTLEPGKRPFHGGTLGVQGPPSGALLRLGLVGVEARVRLARLDDRVAQTTGEIRGNTALAAGDLALHLQPYRFSPTGSALPACWRVATRSVAAPQQPTHLEDRSRLVL